MRNLERGPALSGDNPLAVLTTSSSVLGTLALQIATKASESMCVSMVAFVFDKSSAYEIHVLWALFLLLQALIREAFLEGGNWWRVEDNICKVILLLTFLHCDLWHIQCQQRSLETVSSKTICLCRWYLVYLGENKQKSATIPLPPHPRTWSQ